MFIMQKTLLDCGNGPDTNRRFVVSYPAADEIASFMASDRESGWTDKDQRAVIAYVYALNYPSNPLSTPGNIITLNQA